MIFYRTILSALCVGLLAGLILSATQMAAVTPIIIEAESFEQEQTPLSQAPLSHGAHDHSGHSHGDSDGHHHSPDAWAPDDGLERTLYTVFANVLASIGFAAVLLAIMSQLQLQGFTRLSPVKGVLWGAAGFIVFFVAPSIGLPPEIPGAEAAPLGERQSWWTLSVVCVGAGLLIIAFTPLKYKLTGLIAIAIPYVVYIPRHEGAVFTHSDPAAVVSLTELHHQFIIASGISNLIFWLALGFISALFLKHWVHKDIPLNTRP
ncbi:MAG: hypothetical protein COA42_16380 [Alteromonadaceae bacterium]|nr:MAG: hypothetical protein COA42_16380 [Alteromonadaceae bacterium]